MKTKVFKCNRGQLKYWQVRASPAVFVSLCMNSWIKANKCFVPEWNALLFWKPDWALTWSVLCVKWADSDSTWILLGPAGHVLNLEGKHLSCSQQLTLNTRDCAISCPAALWYRSSSIMRTQGKQVTYNDQIEPLTPTLFCVSVTSSLKINCNIHPWSFIYLLI